MRFTRRLAALSVLGAAGGLTAGAWAQCPATTCEGDHCLVTQSLDTVTNSENSIACGVSGVGTTENGWARCYDLAVEGVPSGDFMIESVMFGVQQATVDGIMIDVVLYLDGDGCPPTEPGLDATELARQSVMVDMADVGTFITVEFPDGPIVPSGMNFIVEIYQVVDGTEEPTFQFRPMSNDLGQCGSSYIRADGCGITGWVALEDIGFPDAHLIQVVHGSVVDEAIEAPLDIKAGSCPNAFNRKSNGKLPVALVGTDAFDVMMVDFWSLEISRADGMGGSLAPLGDHGPKYDDVATPFDGEGCECHEMYGDGITDLKMKFSRPDLVEMLELHDFEPGDDVELTLTGMLTDGTEFYANDCLWLVPAGDASLDGIVDTTDLLMVLSSWGPCVADNANVIECPADLDGNDAVGLEDLLLVLGDWGAGL